MWLRRSHKADLQASHCVVVVMFVFVVNTRAQHACCAVSFWWFHLLRWLLGGNTYAQLLGSNQRLNGHHTARGGVSNIEPLTRVQEETRV